MEILDKNVGVISFLDKIMLSSGKNVIFRHIPILIIFAKFKTICNKMFDIYNTIMSTRASVEHSIKLSKLQKKRYID